VNQSASTLPAISALWILASCLTRSGLLGWIDQRLKASAIAETTSGTVGYVTRIDRRRFLIRIGGASAVVTVAGASIGMFSDSVRRAVLAAGDCWSSANSLPNADAAVAPAPGTRTEYTPLERHYRIDINTSPPRINGEKWRLKIDGLVETPITLTLDELRRHRADHIEQN
jgi:Oxidoreductase molybdopterin binding domain